MFIHTLFENAADAYSDSVAIESCNQVMSYKELNKLSNQIAHLLISNGIGPGEIVGVSLKKSPLLIASLIAILKTGAAYLPLDPEYPLERLKYMIGKSNISFFVTEELLTNLFTSLDIRIIELTDSLAHHFPDKSPIIDNSRIELTYVIYTSGSTGNPKGVVMGHRALLNLIQWQQSETPVLPGDGTLHFSPISFDVHFQEIFSTLCFGGRLVIANETQRIDPISLLNLLQDKNVKRVFFPYVWFHQLSDMAMTLKIIPSGIQEIITAGEQLKITQSIREFVSYLKRPKLYNHYGPSETHVATSFKLFGDSNQWPDIPAIGKPISHVEAYILDDFDRPVQRGEVGEIFLGGVCLAHGYHHAQDLTNERFVRIPNIGLVYKTGDLGRLDEDNNIHFVGRRDAQVKIRGYRIEPGEIEIALLKIQGVQACAVKVCTSDDDKKLYAYYSGKANSQFIRKELRKNLPDYMIPSSFVQLKNLPVTPSGKVDYKRLPDNVDAPILYNEYFSESGNVTQEMILRVWKKILKIKKVGVNDNFFDVGGNSLLAIKVIFELNLVTSRKISLLDFYSCSTVEKLAEFLDGVKSNTKIPQEAEQIFSHQYSDIAVIGMTGRFPGIKSVDELWENLIAVNHFASGKYPEKDSFDYQFFGITPREAELMDPQQRKFLELAHEALEVSGHGANNFSGRIGVFAGMGTSNYKKLVESHHEKTKFFGEFNTMIGLEKDYIAPRVSYSLNLRGPALSLHTACSTSLVAIVEAVKSLRLGECEMALAGGIAISGDLYSRAEHIEGGILSKDKICRSFDAEASGTLFADGAGIVVLKRLSDAEKDNDLILAVIKGVGLNNDGADKMSFGAPSVSGQSAAIYQAHLDAGISADSIGFVEAHGTGTPVGDPIEIEALRRAFLNTTLKNQFCHLGAVKSNIGHLTSAAGVTGFIKAVKVVQEGIIPGIAHFKKPNELLNIDQTPFILSGNTVEFPTRGTPRRAGVSSFGVGGTNAHVVIEEYSSQKNLSTSSERINLFLISAKSQKQCDELKAKLIKQIKESTLQERGRIAYTLALGRNEYPFRYYLVTQNKEEDKDFDIVFVGKDQSESNPELCFVFPGQGSQYSSMGKNLYKNNHLFRLYFDECCAVADTLLGCDLKRIIFDLNLSEKLNQTLFSQVATYIIEYSLAKTLEGLGISPQMMIGHSLGEFAVATLNGVFNLKDALKILIKRAQLMSLQPEGRMLSVASSYEDATNLIKNYDLDIAAINGKKNIVISGSVQAIHSFKEFLSQTEIAWIELNSQHAFHSRWMQTAALEFCEFLQSFELKKPDSNLFSTITAKKESEIFATPDYWAQHMVATVNFKDTIRNLDENKNLIFLEVGPGSALTQLIKKEKNKSRAIALLKSQFESEECLFKQVIGVLWSAGVKISNLSELFLPEFHQKISAPTYVFETNQVSLIPNETGKSFTHQESSMLHHSSDSFQNVKEALIDLFYRTTGIEINDYTPETSFMEMGMDSLFLTQISLQLKKEFHVPINFRQLVEEYFSLEKLTAFLAKECKKNDIVLSPPLEIKDDLFQAGDHLSCEGIQAIIQGQLQLMAQQMLILSNAKVSLKECSDSQKKVLENNSNSDQVTTNAKGSFGAQARITVERTTSLNERQQRKIIQFYDDYIYKTKKSKNFTQANRKNHADPRVVSGFRPETKEIIYPIVVNKSSLQKMWDLDGNEYVNMTCGFGSNFFGNGNEKIKKYILQQVEEGFELGPQHPLVEKVSRLINELTGNERTAFCNTGSEAVLGAMRIARTITGREKIIVFSGSYHGINDEVILRGLKTGQSYPAAPGINREAVENMIVLDYGTAEALSYIRKNADQVAAILVEPVQSRRSNFHPSDFLKEVRSITNETKTCLIFDEIITGFRIHPGGAQAYFGVRADLCTYGKIVGGGMPIGVISGKSEYMDALDGGFWQYDDDSNPRVGVTYFAGTFVRHPLALAAARGALEIIKEGGEQLFIQLNDKAQKFVNELNLFLKSTGCPMEIDNFGSLLKPRWVKNINLGELFYAQMRYYGVHVYDGFPWFVNLAHTDKELAFVLEAFKKSMGWMIEVGLIEKKIVHQGSSFFDKSVFDQKGAPLIGAILGRDEAGDPAWFLEDENNTGEYFIINKG